MSKFVRADGRVIYPQTSLTREQKEVIGLLSIGTFLEYFDLMLYVHMAVLLNELFFPKTDPHTATLLSAAAFCSTYLMRPFGALIFGWIGDNIGRKVSVVITTMMMAMSCMVMANLPTFAQIGITAAWLVTICRIIQGITSMGEIVGAELYLTEYLQPPRRYVAVAFIGFCAAFGYFAAVGVAHLVTSYGLNWRLAFWIGTVVALVGMIARTTLRETPEFADAKRRLNKTLQYLQEAGSNVNVDHTIHDTTEMKINWKTTISCLLADCIWPVMFYVSYMHCANIFKYSFNYTAEQIIHNNLIVSIAQLVNVGVVVYLSRKVHPLRILKIRFILATVFLFVTPFLLHNVKTGLDVTIVQLLLMLFLCDASSANSIFFKHFPIFKRFTYVSAIYAVSRAIVYFITSVSLIYLTEYFGQLGLYFITIPTTAGFAYGLSHFIKLEKDAGNFSEKKTYVESAANTA
ncbi:MFS transporter [Candidatus Tisiphia endosymbiont of Temnostethus pusillus]|uniref:MFS transporter n=1 Tax=Candidatus Tisiphia endosymbiont of Temnostethus pusillus TaxID=3139335 RepID=UPI0035C89B0C